MNKKQKKLIENWLVLFSFIVAFVFIYDADWAQWAALPISVYVLWNWSHIYEFQHRSPKPGAIIESSSGIKFWVYGSSLILVSVSLVFLLTGLSILDYLGFGSLLLLVFLPFLPIIFVSQVALYNDLANER